MEEDNKLPLKRVELSLTKFNEVAIPHHLDLLRQHKTNIIKYESEGNNARARSEQTHARRVTSQLRALLQEMDALRAQLRGGERARFDALTQRSRDATLEAVQDYLGLIESSCRTLAWTSPARLSGSAPLCIERRGAGDAAASAVSTDSVGVVLHLESATVPLDDLGQIQLHVDDQELQLAAREELLRGWAELHAELRELHAVWQRAHAAAQHQREHVHDSAASTRRAHEHVGAARAHLAGAERLRAAAGAGCALAGALVGGPLGLALGVKAGALGAAAGSLLGYLGARALGRRALPAPPALPDKDQ